MIIFGKTIKIIKLEFEAANNISWIKLSIGVW